MSEQKPLKYFGTDGIRGRVGTHPITPEFVLKLGYAVGCVLARQGSGKVLIGKDTRISGYMFESVLEAGLSAAGIDTQLLGPMPTPAIAYLTRTLRAQAGIVISASHNPYHDNGIKFFSSSGMKLPQELEYAIEEMLDIPMTVVNSDLLGKAIRVIDAPGRYIEFCKSTIASDMMLHGLKIVVDCAHGAAYHVAPSVFRELGAQVIEVGVEPNGLNINLGCGATHLDLLQQTVIAEKADLGIALDGDGDRVMMVDHHGKILDGDDLLYIIIQHRHQAGLLKGGIVGTVMTNLALEQAILALDVPFVRVPVGDKNVLAELIKQGWHLGGEPSGHVLCLDLMPSGDGIIAALQVLEAMQAKRLSLSEMRNQFVKFPQILLNVSAQKSHEILAHDKVQKALDQAKNSLQQGRVLLRPSGTEPLIRIMVEGQEIELVQKVANHLKSIVMETIEEVSEVLQ